ncbi:MAG: hypothetical protein JXK05_04915 [Campylobacterales bacterium]|nr:hypothetical protein [Campylobacterales bacterium]
MIAKPLLLSLCTILLLGGCSQKYEQMRQSSQIKLRLPQTNTPAAPDAPVADENASLPQQEPKKPSLTVERVNPPERFKHRFSPPPTTAILQSNESSSDNEQFKISAERIPVDQFIDLVFGTTLQLNYSYDEPLRNSKKSISLNMSQPCTKAELLSLARVLLQEQGVHISQVENTYFFDTAPKQSEPAQAVSNFIYGRTLPSGMLEESNEVSLFAPYHYVNAAQILRVQLRDLLPKSTTVIDIPTAQLLILKDTPSNLRQALELLNFIDRPALQEKQMVLMRLEHIDAELFMSRVEPLLIQSGIPIKKNATQIGMTLQPIAELNALFIVADHESWIETLEYWRSKLDDIALQGEEPQMFVYAPKNRNAEELVEILNELIVSTPATIKSNPSTTNAASATPPQTTKEPQNTGPLSQQRVILDKTQNNLIIYATPATYKQLHRTLAQLDTRRKQVLIEVTIAEVTLSDQLQFGVEWFLKSQGSDWVNTIGTAGALGLGANALSGTLLKNSAYFEAMFNAFAQEKLLNVLSSPRVLVLDREAASINVGSEIPILTSDTTSSTTDTTNTTKTQAVQYRNTGVILSVTPYISSHDILTLELSQEVSEADVNAVSKIDSPSILNRSLKTKVLLSSGQTVMLGGLIKENKSTTYTKVPLLGDIPYLGELFKSESDGTTNTELIITIKPLILSDTHDHEQLKQAIAELYRHIDLHTLVEQN